jgi:hypothetical protein
VSKAAFSALLLVLGGCSDTCDNTVVSRLLAPDERHEAVMFQRDCGATTGFSTQISILSAGRDVSGAGDAFRADDDHGAARTGAWGGPWADMTWLSSDHLLVRYAAKSRLFAHDEDVSGVRITYQAVGG